VDAQQVGRKEDFYHLFRRLHVASVLCGWRRTINQMVLVSLAAGHARRGAGLPLSQAVMLDSYALPGRKAMSIWGMGVRWARFMGTSLGAGADRDHSPGHWWFFCEFAFGPSFTVLGLDRLLDETKKGIRAAVRLVRASRRGLAVGIGSCRSRSPADEHSRLESNEIIGEFRLGGSLLLFFRPLRSRRQTVHPRCYLQDRIFLAAACYMAVYGSGAVSTMAVVSPFLQKRDRLIPSLTAGLLLATRGADILWR